MLREKRFLQQHFGVDISKSIEDVQKELEQRYCGVPLEGFCINDCSLWAALIIVEDHEIDEGKLEEYYQLCYQEMELTEAEIRERLSHLGWVSRCVIGRDGHVAGSYHIRNHLATICRILRAKYAQIASEINRSIIYRFTPLRSDSVWRDPALELMQRLFMVACISRKREDADSAWREIKAILDARQSDPNVLCELPNQLFAYFFNEPIEWCSKFDLNQPSERDNKFIWERLPTIHLTDIMRCTSFNPRLKSKQYASDVLSEAILLRGVVQKNWSEKLHSAIQRCLPLMDPKQAHESWFHSETHLYADPTTCSVVFEYISANWPLFPPQVTLFGEITSYMKFKQYLHNKNKAAPPEELQMRISETIWRRILHDTSTIAQLQQSAELFLDTDLPLTESLVKFLCEKDASGLKPMTLDPLRVRSVLQLVLKAKLPKKSECCVS